jgi:hypothetical protein
MVMPKPAKRVSEVRPRQAIFAAGIKQFPRRLIILTEGDSCFSYPLDAKHRRLHRDDERLLDPAARTNGDEAREILGAVSEQLKKLKYYLKSYWQSAVKLARLSRGFE